MDIAFMSTALVVNSSASFLLAAVRLDRRFDRFRLPL